MRVLYLTPSFPPMVGGGERYAGALAHQLSSHGHELMVVTSAAQNQEDFWLGSSGLEPALPSAPDSPAYQVIRCPVRPMTMGRTGLSLWRKAMVTASALPGDHQALLGRMAGCVPPIEFGSTLDRLGPFDIIHAFNVSWEYPLVLGAALANRHKIPFVVTPFAHLGRGPHDKVALNNTMQHQIKLLQDADAVLALTSVEREGLIARGVGADRIHILPAGLEQAGATPDAAESSVPSPWPRPYVCFVGRNSRDKGAIQTLQAIVDLLRQGIRVDLALLGPTETAFERQLSRLPERLRAHIHVLGIVDEQTKQAVIAQSAMLVLPSRVDSFGIVILEAWCHKRPVIGARSGGIPGLIRENADGLLVEHGDVDDLADRILWLLRNPKAAQRMGERGQRRLSAEFDWSILGERLVNLYETLLTERAPSP